MNVAFWGIGLMGQPMAERILSSGHVLVVYNRTQSKTLSLQSKGAKVCRLPQDSLVVSNVIVCMLANAPVIEQIVTSLPKNMWRNKTFIQMATIGVKESCALRDLIESDGGKYIESPVLGSRAEASSGNLILMVGARRKSFEQWEEFLKIFGTAIYYVGDIGQAAALKLALNQLIAMHAASFSLSLGIVEKNKISIDLFMSILKQSTLFASMYEKKLPMWIKREYKNPNFSTKMLLKDVDLIIAEAKDKALNAEVLIGLRDQLEKTIQSGFSDDDYCSVREVIVPSKDLR